MRWNCPHCGVALAVADEKLGAGWSFSRCYQCNGFALIRKSDVNLIKVDRAPMGEKIVVPEGTPSAANPTHGAGNDTPVMLSKQATQNLAEHLARVREKPTVRPGSRRPSLQSQARLGADGNVHIETSTTPSAAPVVSNAETAFPQGTGAVSGVNGNASNNTLPPRFIPKAEARGVSIPQPALQPMADLIRSGEIPMPLPDHPRLNWQHRILPIAIAIAGLSALASGIYLYMQGKELWKKAKAGGEVPKIAATQIKEKSETAPAMVANANVAKNEIVDQVRQSAMAPDRRPAVDSPAAINAENANTAVGAIANAANAETENGLPAMLVQARFTKVSLRSGPGLEYNIKGHANPEIKYIVSDWKDRWFKVIMPGNESAWIRNDMVQLFTGGKAQVEMPSQPGLVTR